jgi:polyhydroxybutyrate depolymerase
VVLAPALAGAAGASRARTEELIVATGGGARRYRLHVPPQAADGRALPLVVVFHGAGATVDQQERASGLSALADREGFVVAYPEGVRRRWAVAPGVRAEDEVRFVRDLVADVSRQLPIDARRVYATGISNGGAMAGRVACDLAGVFAAVATVAGAYPPADECHPSRPVPVLAFHGLADRVVPYAGRAGAAPVEAWAATWAARDGCAAEPAVDRSTPGLVTRRWSACAGGAEVVLHAIAGLAHDWPGEFGRGPTPIAASSAMWAFFREHPAP